MVMVKLDFTFISLCVERKIMMLVQITNLKITHLIQQALKTLATIYFSGIAEQPEKCKIIFT